MFTRLASWFQITPSRDPDLERVPFDAIPERRGRTRRGGPRTPLSLVGLIAVLCGVGVAYVGQMAHATESTYEAGTLQVDQVDLRTQAAHLDDELARQRATERIVAAAQVLGMRPAGQWAYVAARPVAVLPAPNAVLASTAIPTDPLQRFIATLGGAVGVHDVEAAAP